MWVGATTALVAVGVDLDLGLGLPSSPGRGASGLHLAPLSTLGRLVAAPAPGAAGPEGVPVPDAPPLATTAQDATGQSADGISCDTSEHLLFHVHTHLMIFVDGQPRQVPYGIAIVPPRTVSQTANGPFVTRGSCFYWLHTHADDGIIHIESPVQRTFTLGDFFAIWGQPLVAPTSIRLPAGL